MFALVSAYLADVYMLRSPWLNNYKIRGAHGGNANSDIDAVSSIIFISWTIHGIILSIAGTSKQKRQYNRSKYVY